MKQRKDLHQSQLFESIYAPVQTLDKVGENQKLQLLKNDEQQLNENLDKSQRTSIKFSKWIWRNTLGHFAEEWTFLAVLGTIVALISYGIDKGVLLCNNARLWLYRDLADTPSGRYFGWISLPICLILFSAGFVKLVGPKAAGSGIPEIKTILRGVFIGDFLTFPTLLAKVVGLTSTLGSGLPLGKEGPLIHISSCCAHLLGQLVSSFQGIYQNESRKLEIIGSACAVGVACTFGAPIGGVLLSVEITTSYFAVRNYWRGFCAAVWGATVYRLLLVWIEGVQTVTVVFKTSFFVDTPFAAQELFAFAILGVICGFGGAFYMQMKIKYGKFMCNSKKMKQFQQINFFLYPGLIVFIVSSLSYPRGFGQFMAADLPAAQQVTNLFANFTWTQANLTVTQNEIVQNWQTKYTNIYFHLSGFIVYQFVCSIIASSIPIPNGTFIPIFRMGAATGRIMGELMHDWYPTGLSYYGRVTDVIPGGYAIVGAAAFTGAVTQTVSVAVIALEMTSQITHAIPILIAVLIANSIAQLLGPSIYNSVIKAKKLPYLPDLLPSKSAIYRMYVEDFMIRDFKCLHRGMSYEDLRILLLRNKKLQSFPLVNDENQMILIGSISRCELVKLINQQIGLKRRYEELLQQDNRSTFTNNPIYEEKPNEIQQNDDGKKIQNRIIDLPIEEQKQWEQNQMRMLIDFNLCHIDPAPFQLVERTSLLKVHSLFSLVGITYAYVTSLGKLIGVVGLDELRQTIEDLGSGKIIPPNKIEEVVVIEDSNKPKE